MIDSKTIKELVLPSKNLKVKEGGPLGMGMAGFLAPELAQFAYAIVSALVIFFTWTNIDNPQMLLWQRVSFLSGTLALWVVYKLWPCRLMIGLRIAYLLVMLGFWYPDTYEINKQFGCLDHIFASYEQDLFGFQPALLFSKAFGSVIVSELMYMGYVSYYLFFVVTVYVVFFKSYQQVEKVSFLILAAFFVCYSLYLVMPVVGPQYYYPAIGEDAVMRGSFTDIEAYFRDSIGEIHGPGWTKGIFYYLCQIAHQSGERPTAAFPSSHVAIATLVMCIVARMRMWRYFLFLAIPYIFLCLSTVYIMAHYAIDAMAGFIFGIMLFLILGGMRLNHCSK